MSPPAFDWRLCSNLLEHPSCDDAAHADVQSSQPCNAVCRAGETQGCQRDGCPGSQTCIGGQAWSECVAPRPCPDGWWWTGSECVWISPNQPSYVKYYPHRTGNDQVAATGAIGYPAAGGQPATVYVEVTLDQWSNPPAGDGGNYCGKDGFVSAWVGCIHPNNQRGYGRDVADVEWEDGVMIPLRCDPGDLVGVYKYSWGHYSSWHCTRQLALLVVRTLNLVFGLQRPDDALAIARQRLATDARCDEAVHHQIRTWLAMLEVYGGDIVAAAADSLIFPALAFGLPLLWPVVLGQFVAKVVGGAVWSWMLRRREAIHAA